jgi:hypothetical protein
MYAPNSRASLSLSERLKVLLVARHVAATCLSRAAQAESDGGVALLRWAVPPAFSSLQRRPNLPTLSAAANSSETTISRARSTLFGPLNSFLRSSHRSRPIVRAAPIPSTTSDGMISVTESMRDNSVSSTLSEAFATSLEWPSWGHDKIGATAYAKLDES